MSNVRIDKQDDVTIVTIHRPDVRNAVDGPTAVELADAFRDFDADDTAKVAILTGAKGTFCAGADLKGVAQGRGNRAAADGDGPMGPNPDAAVQTGDRGRSGLRCRWRPGTGHLV